MDSGMRATAATDVAFWDPVRSIYQELASMPFLCTLDCKAYVYNTETGKCWLKSAASDPENCPACQGRNEIEMVRPVLFYAVS